MFPERRDVTDDRDIDERRMTLRLFSGENGDWYLAVGSEGDKFTRHCVRITTSGQRPPLERAAMLAADARRGGISTP